MKLSISQATRIINSTSSSRISSARTFSSQECFSFYPSKGKRVEQNQQPQQLEASSNRECFSYYPSRGKRDMTAATTSSEQPLTLILEQQQEKPVPRPRYNSDVGSKRWVADVAMQYFSNKGSARNSARAYHNESTTTK